jgi:glycosyltransferase involved in cell wall biosynthesis
MNSRPVIAIATNYPYDGRSFTGGVESATAGLLESLAAYAGEFSFHILALTREIPASRVEERQGMTFHFIAIPSQWYAQPHLVPNVLRARAEISRIRPDLVHCQDNMALAVGAVWAGCKKRVFTVHGIKSVEAQLWQGAEYWSHQMDALIERWVRSRFEHVITVSPYVTRFLPRDVKTHEIPNAVPRIFFCPDENLRDHRMLLFVGSLTRLKRPLDVIRVFERVKAQNDMVSLSIIGAFEDRAYQDEMKQYISKQGIKDVFFLGPMKQAEVALFMRRAAALVLTSVQENSPMVIAEAMAGGLPVIASKVGGVPAMVDDEKDGLLFESGDVHSAAEAVIRLLKDQNLRGDLARNGRRKAETMFSPEVVARKTVELYNALLAS